MRSAEQKAELLLRVIGSEPEQGKDLGLDDRVMAANRAAAAFFAVDDQVVSLRPHCAGLGVEQMQVFKKRHGERVVFSEIAFFLGVPREKRKTNDPRIMERFGVVELELRRESRTQGRECEPGYRLSVRDDQDKVAGAGAEAGEKLTLHVGDEELGGRSAQRLSLDLEPDQALGADPVDIFGESVQVLAAVSRPPPGTQIPLIR